MSEQVLIGYWATVIKNKNIIMLLKTHLTCAFLLSIFLLTAQMRTFGGNDTDKGYAMDRLSSGEIYIAGSVESLNGDAAQKHVNDDAWVIKCDAQLQIIWQQKLGGLDIDEGHGIAVTPDLGCVIVGITQSTDSIMATNHGDKDGFIAKYDANGTREWLKLVGGTSYEALYKVKTTNDGGYISIGLASSQNGDVQSTNGQWDIWAVKFSATGNIEWQNTLGGTDLEVGFDIQQCADGSFIAVGAARSTNGDVSGLHGEWDMWVLKLSQTGDLLWQKALGGTGSDGGYSIQEIENVGYIAAGWSVSPNDGDVQGNHGSSDAWIVRLDMAGNLIGQNCLGGTSSEQARCVRLTNDGWIATGYTRSADGDIDGNAGLDDAWIAKWSLAGNLIGVERISGSQYDILLDILPLSDNSFLALGWTDSQDGDIDSTKGQEDVWLLQNSITTPLFYSEKESIFSFYPNPVSSEINISLSSPSFFSITDITGKTIERFEILPPVGNYDIEHLPDGLFFLKNENKHQVRTLIIQKQ